MFYSVVPSAKESDVVKPKGAMHTRANCILPVVGGIAELDSAILSTWAPGACRCILAKLRSWTDEASQANAATFGPASTDSDILAIKA